MNLDCLVVKGTELASELPEDSLLSHPLHQVLPQAMQTLYKRPRIATLKHRETPYRGEWIIYQYANHEYTACHEVDQMQQGRKTVETVSLKSLADAQAFSGYLSAYGWAKVWEL